jgi:hypothetical protein
MYVLDFVKLYIHGSIILLLSWFFVYVTSNHLVFLIGYAYPIGTIIILVVVLVFPLVIGFANVYIYRYFYERDDEISFPLWTNGLIMLLICSLFLIVYNITGQVLMLLFVPIILGLYGKFTEED